DARGPPDDFRLRAGAGAELPAPRREGVSPPSQGKTAEAAARGRVLRSRTSPGQRPHQLSDGGRIADGMCPADRRGADGKLVRPSGRRKASRRASLIPASALRAFGITARSAGAAAITATQAARLARPGFVDRQGPALVVKLVQGLDRLLRFG